MSEIRYRDRKTKQLEKEKVYGQFFIELLYGNGPLSRCISLLILPLLAHLPVLSKLYGMMQKSTRSRRKVLPFIEKFHIDASEFLDPPESFRSFNDFFIRHLKPEVRPVDLGKDIAVLPADARYLCFPDGTQSQGIWVKGKEFSLEDLLQSRDLAQKYAGGAMAIARLCPVDYHRFHFPCDCIPKEAQLINGPLYSVNPMALKWNIEILSENKRMITPLETEEFGTILYIEVGATHVGSIVQTYTPGKRYAKGEEKGYFSFGGSCLILLFEPKKIVFDADLIQTSIEKIEARGLLGQSMGRS
ncbi:MAG: phosphatidylserine decarboxylase [Verrucomicrobia bacterium]|nr:phosphatidylserine decarboxylase [Verrucomicrobiota bacterium]